ncbi:uncharacterized protein [Medicago truncatula]|uniref:uncharacterized protein n=1 Tax=Medicago truncatula TaxID=3880 RepID=UPI000D2F1FC6|nr:uncharacterized protein LOC112419910 [Medicago truncatula]
MLFKVEITNGNLLHSWRNYGVKRTSDDADLIKMFIKRHDLKIFYDEDDAGDIDVTFTQTNTTHLENVQVQLLEAGDSTKTDVNKNEEQNTPCSKGSGKRSADLDDCDIVDYKDDGEMSINKPVKLKCVKIEKDA